MQLLPWWPSWGEGMLAYIGALLVWSLALYVLTRGNGRVPVLAVLAMGAFAVYLLGLGVGALAFPAEPGRWVAWLRGTWGGATLAPSFWLVLVLALGADEGTGQLRQQLRQHWLRLSVVSLGVGVAFGLLGVSSELVLVWRDALPTV